MEHLTEGLTYISEQEQIGGINSTLLEQENGDVLKTWVLNNTPNTIPSQTFEVVDLEQ